MSTYLHSVVKIIDGDDGELIGYGVCRTTVRGNGVVNGWRMLPEVYSVRSEAHMAADYAQTVSA